MSRRVTIVVAAVGSVLWAVWVGWLLLTRDGQDTVFVVLDNVRSDRLAMCGHGRPTSSALEAFEEAGAWSRCDGVAPGSWTVPSHASYFTGLTVPEHGAHFAPDFLDKIEERNGKPARAFALDEARPTLAETLGERGYETALVSSNPVLGGSTGLTRGFDHVRVASRFTVWYGDGILAQLGELLDDFTPGNQPRFLFINIADAHVPWQAIPEGLDWIRARKRINSKKTPGAPMNKYVAGTLPPKLTKIHREAWNDGYDYGVYRADETFGRVMQLLEDRGWGHARVVVTSDHGEFLGEHRMVSHCCAAYEQNTRVPMLARGFGDPPPVGPFSAANVFRLIVDGAWPADAIPPHNVAGPNPTWDEWSDWFGKQTWVGFWDGTMKRFSIDGERFTIDLAKDPREVRLVPDRDADPGDDVGRMAEAFRVSLEREGSDADMDEQLKALGYLD